MPGARVDAEDAVPVLLPDPDRAAAVAQVSGLRSSGQLNAPLNAIRPPADANDDAETRLGRPHGAGAERHVPDPVRQLDPLHDLHPLRIDPDDRGGDVTVHPDAPGADRDAARPRADP